MSEFDKLTPEQKKKVNSIMARAIRAKMREYALYFRACKVCNVESSEQLEKAKNARNNAILFAQGLHPEKY